MRWLTGLLVRSSGPSTTADNTAPAVSNARGSPDNQAAFAPNADRHFHSFAAAPQPGGSRSRLLRTSWACAYRTRGCRQAMEFFPVPRQERYADARDACRRLRPWHQTPPCSRISPASRKTCRGSRRNVSRQRAHSRRFWLDRAFVQPEGVCQRVALGRTVMVTTPVTPELSFLIRVVPTLRARNFGV